MGFDHIGRIVPIFEINFRRNQQFSSFPGGRKEKLYSDLTLPDCRMLPLRIDQVINGFGGLLMLKQLYKVKKISCLSH